jgi:hypothetical protein
MSFLSHLDIYYTKSCCDTIYVSGEKKLARFIKGRNIINVSVFGKLCRRNLNYQYL